MSILMRTVAVCSNVFRSEMNTVRYYTARRALLYVPGDDERKLKKAFKSNADCVAFDCEDGVAINKKADARETIRKFFEKHETEMNKKGTEFGVRVNSVESDFFEDDVNVIFSSNVTPKTILLPKVNSINELEQLHKSLQKNLVKKMDPINLIFYAESCQSVMNLPQICESAINLGKRDGLFRPVGIVFGSDDFCASLGAVRSENSLEILHARQRTVMIAKAFELQAIDMVYIDFRDEIGLNAQSEEGARFGYTGKQIIHPGQIDIVQKAFTPSDEKIKWAIDLVDAFDKHQETGKGAFVHKNQMIDMPTVRQAKNILELKKKC